MIAWWNIGFFHRYYHWLLVLGESVACFGHHRSSCEDRVWSCVWNGFFLAGNMRYGYARNKITQPFLCLSLLTAILPCFATLQYPSLMLQKTPGVVSCRSDLCCRFIPELCQFIAAWLCVVDMHHQVLFAVAVCDTQAWWLMLGAVFFPWTLWRTCWTPWQAPSSTCSTCTRLTTAGLVSSPSYSRTWRTRSRA